jgi:predicted permease
MPQTSSSSRSRRPASADNGHFREGRTFAGSAWLTTVAGDAAYAMRQMRRNPGLAGVIILSLALGIAANTTVFSLIDAIWLRRLPVREPNGLVRIAPQRQSSDLDSISWPEFVRLRAPLHTVTALAAHYSFAPLQVEFDRTGGEMSGAVVSASYFDVLGLKPARGRFFSATEDSSPDRDAVAVISTTFAGRLGGPEQALRRMVRINRIPFRIVGVMDPHFHGELSGGSAIDLWIPAMMIHAGYRWCDGLRTECPIFELIGRLAPGATAAAAQAELTARLRAVDGELRATAPRRAAVEAAIGFPRALRDSYADQMKMLLAVTAALWLLACANVGGLLLARAEARSQEIAVRRALGAAGLRLARQMLTETFVLAALAAAVALAATRWTRQLLVAFYAVDSEGYRTFFDLRIDHRVLALAVGFALATALLFGLAPALRAARGKPMGVGRRATSTNRFGPVLVTIQLAMSAVLLVATGLLVQSSLHLAHGQRFDPEHVALSRLRPALFGRTPGQAQAFLHRALDRIAALPGVESVAVARGQGLLWKRCCTQEITLPGRIDLRAGDSLSVDDQEVGPDYFRTLRIPLLRGRDFDSADRVGTAPVAIVNETLAQRLGGSSSVLGTRLIAGPRSWDIVGVVPDAQVTTQIQGATPFVYLAFWQNPDQVDARIAVRSRSDPRGLFTTIRRAVALADPEIPVTEQLTLADQVAGAYAQPRLTAAVTLITGALALVMSAVGLASVIAFGVRRRTRELGIRMALGATRSNVRTVVLREAIWCLAIGLGIGLSAALATVRLLTASLYGVRSTDPVAFAIAAVALISVGWFAAWLPAQQAAHLDPVDALRVD